jgi:exopolyphosphatase/guanosine-5'-triphosphate,3'-diphosphate pyrophosphatase
MMIGNVNEAWRVEPVENIRLPVRLGADVFSTGAIHERTMRHAVDAFRHFRRVADDLGVLRIRAVATSAVREASNGALLLDRIARSSGIEVETISGLEEARLIHLAVANAVSLKSKRAVLIDIGGGSVEVTLSEDRNILSTESYDMGTVRLLQKLDGHAPSGSQREARRSFGVMVREYAEAARRRIDRELGKARVDLCIGTGGNVEDLGRLRQRHFGKSDGQVITVSELHELIEELDGMTVKERIRKLKLRPDRADVILPAAIVLHLIAREAGARRVLIPQVGLKDGVLLELAEEMRKGPHAPRREQVWESAMRLVEKYRVDAEHARLTARLARQLFDQSVALHDLGEEDGLLLEIAALLHDIGHFIGTIDHDRHGYYILKANRLIGLSEAQQEVVASLVLHHRKSSPSFDGPEYRALPARQRMVVGKLSALLRLADGLDVSHARHVTNASLSEDRKGRWQLVLHGRGDLMIELWALDKRRGLFEEMFGVPLEIVSGKA